MKGSKGNPCATGPLIWDRCASRSPWSSRLISPPPWPFPQCPATFNRRLRPSPYAIRARRPRVVELMTGGFMNALYARGACLRRSLLPVFASLSITAAPAAEPSRHHMLTDTDLRLVAPALEKYQQRTLFGELWKRPDLSPRDRSIV